MVFALTLIKANARECSQALHILTEKVIYLDGYLYDSVF